MLAVVFAKDKLRKFVIKIETFSYDARYLIAGIHATQWISVRQTCAV